MSLLINGMDMPKDCSDCYLSIYYDGYNGGYGYCTPGYRCRPLKRLIEEDNKKRNYYPRPSDCPIIEIPTPHGRLIDADRLIAVLKSTTSISQSDYNLFNHVIGLIEHQPVIIEKEK